MHSLNFFGTLLPGKTQRSLLAACFGQLPSLRLLPTTTLPLQQSTSAAPQPPFQATSLKPLHSSFADEEKRSCSAASTSPFPHYSSASLRLAAFSAAPPTSLTVPAAPFSLSSSSPLAARSARALYGTTPPAFPSPSFSTFSSSSSSSSSAAAAAAAPPAHPPPARRSPSPALRARLAALLPGRVSEARDVLTQHGTDESYHEPLPPDLVVWPESTEEVAAVVAACASERTPVVPYGAGTSIEGHVGALYGGVCVDLSRMDRVLEVNVEDMDCRVQAGVTRRQLNSHLRGSGLFFPVDPGADASLGGMAATRASGTNAVRYGTMREAVMGVTAVLAEGRILRTGRRCRKSSAGFDLTALLVGSEGSLGIITEVSLRLHPLPEKVAAAVVTFPEPGDTGSTTNNSEGAASSGGGSAGGLRGAVECVVALMGCGVPLARVELLDEMSMRAVNQYSGTSFTPAPTLFFEFHGSPAAVSEQAELVGSIAREYGGSGFEWATNEEERARLWSARHTAYWAAISLRPGCKGFPTDVCVPISRLPECIMESQRDAKRAGLLAPLVGHVGDGNFHMMLVVDPRVGTELRAARRLVRRMVHRALGMQGTCTGEHGIGYGKLPYMLAEHGRVPLEAMHAIKAAWDPYDILNPGKLGSRPDVLEMLAAEDEQDEREGEGEVENSVAR
ncbi:hypothetical protein Agub_g7066 [Astrephomene gubernaculifera]|uniref:D-lactate dehydrogenase (cytochrome) n=1 Tax=Astrephomene gubernaculifera TaxID=47775 RepID=A0AAD3DPK0_9CHLO|nr:hypothetical protein Agub_g7066 [Astrephomene gubernaculifera]